MEVEMARKHEREAERSEGRPSYAKDVGADLNRLQGKSRSDLMPDNMRGQASPLGHGMGAKKIKERGR
jgi:hypothetical protein